MRATRFVLPLSGCLVLLSGCMYADTPEGRFGAIDIPLPVSSHTTINKTVTVNAPPGTTVNISETVPPTVIYRDRPPPRPRHCYYDDFEHRRVCRW
nr:spore coat-associated protein camelysin [uncultured Kingella sp.]